MRNARRARRASWSAVGTTLPGSADLGCSDVIYRHLGPHGATVANGTGSPLREVIRESRSESGQMLHREQRELQAVLSIDTGIEW
jgi:hypothetical protein